MVRIISDTSTLYSSAQAREAGFDVAPLSVTIGGKSYLEFDEISPETFVSLIDAENLPTSSQPSVGDVVALYQQYPEDEILNISMAHGLSGTYNGAVAAAAMSDNADRITVINSRTLCGPHRYLVENAVKLANQGLRAAEIAERTNALMDTGKSFLMPADFDYLRRGGRLSPMVSYVGKTISLAPVMTQTDNGEQLALAGVRRGFVNAVKYVIKALEKWGVGEGWRIYVAHGHAPEKAEQAHKLLLEAFPTAEYEVLPLSPAFITQGGPSCVAIQVIHA